MKSFLEAQFSYYQLIWMFYTRELDRKSNHIHERALRIAYETTVALSQNCLKKITWALSTTETSNH